MRFPDAKPRVRRRITGRAWCLIALAFGLFMMAVHFSNNIVFLASFTLLSLVVVAIFNHWTGLSGVSARLVPPPICEAGMPAHVHFSLDGGSPGVHVETPLGRAVWQPNQGLKLSQAGPARGVYALGPAKLVATDPFGLFRAERVLSQAECPDDASLVVYPRPDWASPAPADRARTPVSVGRLRGELAGLRPYRAGDGPGDISWRHSARGQGLMVKEHESQSNSGARHFDWSSVSAHGVEPGLSSLSAAVLTAVRDGAAVSLAMPSHSHAPGRGKAHLDQMMSTLAAFRPEP